MINALARPLGRRLFCVRSARSRSSHKSTLPWVPDEITIRTLNANVKAKIIANDWNMSEGAPDSRVFVGRAELGVARKAQTNGEEPRDYLSFQLDNPSFPEPIRATLLEDDGAAYLERNRRQ